MPCMGPPIITVLNQGASFLHGYYGYALDKATIVKLRFSGSKAMNFLTTATVSYKVETKTSFNLHNIKQS